MILILFVALRQRVVQCTTYCCTAINMKRSTKLMAKCESDSCYEALSCIVLQPKPNATLPDMTLAAYQLAAKSKVPVEFSFNDTHFTVIDHASPF